MPQTSASVDTQKTMRFVHLNQYDQMSASALGNRFFNTYLSKNDIDRYPFKIFYKSFQSLFARIKSRQDSEMEYQKQTNETKELASLQIDCIRYRQRGVYMA